MAGLTSTGLTTLSLPEIIEELVGYEQSNIHEDIDTREDELLGQLNNIVGLALADQWELAQVVYDSISPLTAEGVQLDNLATLVGVTRVAATASNTNRQAIYGDHGTSVDASTQLLNSVTGDLFSTENTITIDRSVCYRVDVVPTAIRDSSVYEITVNGTQASITSSGTATQYNILYALQQSIDANAGTTNVTTSLVDDVLSITTTEEYMTISDLTQIKEDNVWAVTSVTADDTGPTVAATGVVDDLVVAVAGVNGTTNLEAYIIGSDAETDEELRERIQTSQQGGGAGTVAAIEDAVANLDGVTTVSVIENRTTADDGDGRPAKSFEVIVQGGDDDTIAQTIWDTKPLGIETFGTTSVTVQDSRSVDQTVYFSRPATVLVAVRITYTKYAEEDFPDDGETFLREAAVAHITGLGVDVDIIPTRAYGELYSATTGAAITRIEVSPITNSGDSPAAYQETTYEVGASEYAHTTTTDVYMVEV